MFVFYYAVLSAITPPLLWLLMLVQVSPVPPLIKSVGRLYAWACWLYCSIHVCISPNLLMQGNIWLVPWVFFTAYIGCTCLGAAVQGYYRAPSKFYESIGFFVTALLLIDSKPLTDAIGLALFAILWFVQKKRAKSLATS
jgi:TRAP-type uncharacterized transport system fused permease subunit